MINIISDEAVAWFWLAEGTGYLELTKRHEKKGLSGILGYQLTPYMSIANTDFDLMKVIEEWFKAKNIKCGLHMMKTKPPRVPIAHLKVGRTRDVKKLLEILLPYLVGRKRVVCELLLECLNRYGRDGWSEIWKTKGTWIRDERGRILKRSIRWDFEEEKKRFLCMMKYRDRIHSLNRGSLAKLNYEYFSKLWGIEIEDEFQ